jgi:hypothetical protein
VLIELLRSTRSLISRLADTIDNGQHSSHGFCQPKQSGMRTERNAQRSV